MHYGAMNFPVMPILAEIEAIAQLGFDYLELAMDAPMAQHSIIAANKAAISSALQANGLGLVCHLPTFVSTADLTESLRKASIAEMRRSLDVAAELGARKVVLHPSITSGLGVFVLDTVRGYANEFLAEMVAAAQAMSMTICLENMFPRYMMGVEPGEFEAIFKLFPTLKMTLDTGHANIAGERTNRLMRLVEQFGSQIGHLHFSDNLGKRDDHLAVGQGTVNFAELVQRLKEIGYDQTITLEIFDKDRQMLVRSRDLIKSMFG